MRDTLKTVFGPPVKFCLTKQAVMRALKQSQFVPYFQPLVTLKTGQLAGFEVLARWQDPVEGVIPPNAFIPMAEQDGWIGTLMEEVLGKAFAEAASIPESLTLAINVSPFQLQDLRVAKAIQRLSVASGFSLSRLIVEITESALIDNLESAVAVVTELKAMGCKLALDDFGTGYSSLHHLQSLPFDELKVDRSFVSSMTEKRESRKIVSAVIGLGQSLGMVTVAEGIETQAQAEMMLWLGCDLGQGYFYDRPFPAEKLSACISAHREKMVSTNVSAWNKISATNPDVSPSQRLAQLQAVYDGAPIGLSFVDRNLRYVNFNKRLADMNGIQLENHLGSHLCDVIPEIFPEIEPYLKRALDGEATSNVEVEFASTGETRLISYQPGLDEAGEVVGVAMAVADITERKRTEGALKESEAHYRSMVELNPQVLWITDPQGRNLDISPRWDKKTGLMKSHCADYEWLTSVHPDDMRRTLKAIAVSRRDRTAINVEYRVGDSERGWRWKRSMGAPRFNASGDIVCWCGSVQDIDAPTQEPPVGPEGKEKVSLIAGRRGGRVTSIKSTEERRKQALHELDILDTPPEAEFDDLVGLASAICAAPISLVSLIDTERQWFKASVGVAECETPLTSSFCVHAIKRNGLFLVEDATKDKRFQNNPFVIGDAHVRFTQGYLFTVPTAPRSVRSV